MALEIDENRRAILDCKRNLLVIGGPGCGKTTIALAKAFSYIREQSLNRGEQILFLSFSRNARARLLESAENFPDFKELGAKLYVQTFHAFFLEIIKTHGYLLGCPKKISIIPPHDEAALKGDRKDDDPAWLVEKQDLFNQEGKITFDRFAAIVLELITRSERIRDSIGSAFPLIIVDEAQDTDTEQWQIVQAFHGISQLLLLGDLDQQIFDYRPDIDPRRLLEIKEQINPLEITLASDNFRNPNTEILDFARDLRDNSPRDRGYKGMTSMKYAVIAKYRDRSICQSVGILNSKIEEATGEKPKNIAILTPWWKGVKMVSSALKARKIPHRVQFDETATNFSSRLVACLMEPILDKKQHLVWVLVILRDYQSAKGNRKESTKYDGWIAKVMEDGKVSGKTIPYFQGVIEKISQHQFSGNPAQDWKYVQELLFTCEMGPIQKFARQSEFLVAYNRGRIIMRDLGNAWLEHSGYVDARGILHRAVLESQMSSDVVKEEGIHVMTTYKSKGKEFDGVIIFQNEHISPIELRDDNAGMDRSRRLLLVGVTRARHHVLILRQAGFRSKLLDMFNLDGL